MATSAFAELADIMANPIINQLTDIAGNHPDIPMLVRNNLNYAGLWDADLWQNYLKHKAALTELAARDTPQTGHRVLYTTPWGKEYQSAILTSEHHYDSLCQQGSCYFSPNLTAHGLATSISGGAFDPIERGDLIPLDTIDARYWFFGRSWRANGGIYITVPMRRWHYAATPIDHQETR